MCVWVTRMWEIVSPCEAVDDRLDVRRIGRARIDDGNVTGAENVGPRAVQGERAGILGDDATDARRDFFGGTVGEIELTAIRDLYGHVLDTCAGLG